MDRIPCLHKTESFRLSEEDIYALQVTDKRQQMLSRREGKKGLTWQTQIPAPAGEQTMH